MCLTNKYDCFTNCVFFQPINVAVLHTSTDKSEVDCERERALIKQRICLMEEHNAVLFPSPGSNIPGAPASW